MSLLLHYDKITEFKRTFYKDLLTHEHVIGGQIQLNKLTFPDGGVDEEANFWGYRLEKDRKKYLLDSMKEGKDVNLRELLPILPTQVEKVAHQKDVYYMIKSFKRASFKADKKMSFRDFVDTLCEASHTKEPHQKLLAFAVLSQLMGRANFRFSTPAGFGKNSVVTVAGHLFGGADVITNPTRAKLEFLTTNKLLYVDEVVNIKKSEWELIEPFLLATGDHSPSVVKQTRAYGQVGETLNISNFSLGLFYNDIDHYPDPDKYFDFVPNKALLDRFPAFRLYGVFNEDFNEVKKEDIKKTVKRDMESYKDLIYTFTYYKENLEQSLHHYSDSLLRTDIPARWVTNLRVLTKVVDLYCESQDEFHGWMTVINESLEDYEAMIKHPPLLEQAKKRLAPKYHGELTNKLKNKDTFIARNDVLKQVIKTGKLSTSLEDMSEW